VLFDRLELFVKVALLQNLAKAARAIHVSPSSISQRLRLLEKDFGAKLYKKNKHGIELTNAGRVFLSTANQVLTELDTLRTSLCPNSEKNIKTLSVGGTFTPSAKYLPSAIAAFQKTHPEMEVRFLTADRHIVEKSIKDGEVEIGIVQNPSDSCIGEFFTEQFVMDRLVFFACAGHSLAKRGEISFDDLANTPLIVREGWGATQPVLTLLRSRGVKLNVALRCTSPDAVKAAVRSKIGISILFHGLIEEDIQRKELKILKVRGLPRLRGSSYIVYDKAKALNRPATQFLGLLRDMKSPKEKPIDIRSATQQS
jgi:LysR family transcriptional regulator, transcriptional activator of the cysJI operon